VSLDAGNLDERVQSLCHVRDKPGQALPGGAWPACRGFFRKPGGDALLHIWTAVAQRSSALLRALANGSGGIPPSPAAARVCRHRAGDGI